MNLFKLHSNPAELNRWNAEYTTHHPGKFYGVSNTYKNGELVKQITDDGSVQRTRYFKDAIPHRDDGPAYISSGGVETWYKDGMFHRDDGPAMTEKDGGKAWYRYGKLHREDGPAIINADGSTEYRLNGRKVKPF